VSSERELDEGIKSIKSAWRREHNARLNLEKMLEAENAKLREYVKWLEELALRDPNYYRELKFEFKMKRRELGIEVEHD